MGTEAVVFMTSYYMCRPLNKLPPPMLTDNYESTSDCLREEDLQKAAVAGQTEVTCTLCRLTQSPVIRC